MITRVLITPGPMDCVFMDSQMPGIESRLTGKQIDLNLYGTEGVSLTIAKHY